MSGNWALLTGMVRDVKAYGEKLAILGAWKDAGILDGIVVSTWKNQLDEKNEILQQLQRLEARIVIADEMNLVLPGSFLHQMRAVRCGLAAIPAHSAVLRLRADKCHLSPEESHCFHLVRSPALPAFPGHTPVFKGRIASQGGQILTPFFLMDQIFCGLREDLWNLCHFDLRMEIEGSEVIPEQMLYARPFLDGIPVLDLYFRIQRLLCERPLPLWHYLLNGCFASPLFLEVMAAWLSVLATHFRIGFHPETERAWNETRFSEALAETPKGNFLAFDSTMNTLSFGTDGWVRALLERQMIPDLYGSRLLAARTRLSEGRATPWIPGSATLPTEAEDLQQFFAEVLGPGARFQQTQHGITQFTGESPRWKIAS